MLVVNTVRTVKSSSMLFLSESSIILCSWQLPFCSTSGCYLIRMRSCRHVTRHCQIVFYCSALQTFPTTLGECVKVEFCALIPTQYWQWDEESHMFIRLKLPSLGEWKYDCGHFSNYCEVKFK